MFGIVADDPHAIGAGRYIDLPLRHAFDEINIGHYDAPR